MLADNISPQELRVMDSSQLQDVAADLRDETIKNVSLTGGHLGANLGVVELTIALHYVFDTPRDRLIWDVGHQSYPHKIITGRRSRMRSLRAGGGISGFTKRSESEFDPFGAAHAATSISAGLGMAAARDLRKQRHNVITVIGDGSMSAGMAYEALNNAGATNSRLIVILNDNDMSIAEPVGAMAAYFSRQIAGTGLRRSRDVGGASERRAPNARKQSSKRRDDVPRGLNAAGGLFEELGFHYVGPIDGHDLDLLVRCPLRVMTAIWMGLTTIKNESERGDLEVEGDPSLARSMQQWLGLSAFAPQPRRVQ